MILVALLALPLLAAALALVLPPRSRAAVIVPSVLASAAGALAVAVAARCLDGRSVGFGPGEFLRADALSAVLLVAVAGVGAMAIVCGAGPIGRARAAGVIDDRTLRRYHVLVNLFLFTMLLALTANNVGVMWASLEATTIATAFLVGLERSRAALEASWKYILIGSVGIALAFVGTVLGYFNFVARVGEAQAALHWTVLAQVAPRLNPDVLRLSFVFVLIGYGTKAGLAPMHTWLPDAHSEAPAPVSAMMSGALLAVALHAILRWKVVTDACVGAGFTDRALIAAGVFTVLVAATLLLRQTHYKRMLAYSSVEHIGLACAGFGFGPAGTFAALLHLAAHAAGKSLLFLLAGDVRERYRTGRIVSVRGVLRAMPWTGGLFLAGALALLGLPPFGLFVSEYLIFRAGFRAGHPWITAALMVLVASAFVSLLAYFQRMLYGEPPESVPRGDPGRRRLAVLGLNLAVLLLLGIAVPGPLARLLTGAVAVMAP